MPRGIETKEEESAGAPEWMVTFSDCMTLLLTFFVLLLSFSSFDDKKFRKMETALAEALPSIGVSIGRDRDAFTSPNQIVYNREAHKGSEKPTLEEGLEANPKMDPQVVDLSELKVFLIRSDSIFWGKGTLLSPQGRDILSDMASVLKTVPNRVVISERDTSPGSTISNAGMQRSWAVMEYLTNEHGLRKDRFSISATSTVPQETIGARVSKPDRSRDGHILEIVILERSLYD